MESDTTSLCQHYGNILRANGLAKRTIDNYQCSLRGFVRFLGDRPLQSATAEDVVAYQIQIASRGDVRASGFPSFRARA